MVSPLLLNNFVAIPSLRRYNGLGAQYTRTASEREIVMYDLAYIVALFESLPADVRQEILDLAARLATDANSKEQ